MLDGLPFHFVGSLPPSDHPDLLAVAKDRYRAVDEQRFPGLSAFEADKIVLRHRAAHRGHPLGGHCMTSSPPGFDQTLAKARRQLVTASGSPGPGQDPQGPRTQGRSRDRRILKPRWAVPGDLGRALSGEEPADLRLSYRTNAKARAGLEEELFGKRVLFSDKGQDLASTAEVVADYRSQEAAEGDFRQMKDPKVVSFSPMFHWTEQKIRVHVFYCVLALMVARLMAREAERGRAAHERARTARRLRRGPRDRAALPRRTGAPPGTAGDHRDGRHPTASFCARSASGATPRAGHDRHADLPRLGRTSKAPCVPPPGLCLPTTAGAGSSVPTPWAGKTAGPCCSATRPAGRRAPALAADLGGTHIEVAAYLGILGARLEPMAESESSGRRPVRS